MTTKSLLKQNTDIIVRWYCYTVPTVQSDYGEPYCKIIIVNNSLFVVHVFGIFITNPTTEKVQPIYIDYQQNPEYGFSITEHEKLEMNTSVSKNPELLEALRSSGKVFINLAHLEELFEIKLVECVKDERTGALYNCSFAENVEDPFIDIFGSK